MRGCWLVLAKTPKLTVSEIAKAIKEDFDQVVDQKSVTNALQKHRDLFVADESKRPFRWSNR